MFVRIISEDNTRDVAPEIAQALRKKHVVYKCPNCPNLHLRQVTWARLMELIQEMMN